MSTISSTFMKLLALAITAASAPACVGTELSVPKDHPGNAHARSGRLPVIAALRAEPEQNPEESSPPSVAHEAGTPDHHEPEADHAEQERERDHAVHHHGHGDGHGGDARDTPAHQKAHDQTPPSKAGPAAPKPHTTVDKASGPADVQYTCPMHPEIIRKAPGPCPICGMKLVPKKDKQ